MDMEEYATAVQAYLSCKTGAPISDDDLDTAIVFIDRVVAFLEGIGPEFGLARKEIRAKLVALHGFRDSRNM